MNPVIPTQYRPDTLGRSALRPCDYIRTNPRSSSQVGKFPVSKLVKDELRPSTVSQPRNSLPQNLLSALGNSLLTRQTHTEPTIPRFKSSVSIPYLDSSSIYGCSGTQSTNAATVACLFLSDNNTKKWRNPRKKSPGRSFLKQIAQSLSIEAGVSVSNLSLTFVFALL